MDIYDAFNNTSAVSQLSRSSNGRLEEITFESKSETVEFEGDTYEASEIINQLRNGDQFEEPEFHTFVRSTSVGSGEDNGGASTGLIVGSYITGFLLPIIGIIMSIVLFVKGETKHGFGALGLSLFSWMFFAAILM